MSPAVSGPALPDWNEKHQDWEENGSDFIHPTDKKTRTGAFRKEGLDYAKEENRTKTEKVFLGKEAFCLSFRCRLPDKTYTKVKTKTNKQTGCDLNQRFAVAINSYTHYRMWYLTDQSTPAGLSLCLGCGLLATRPSSYHSARERGGSVRLREGRALHQCCFYHITSAAASICTQRHPNNACSAFLSTAVELCRISQWLIRC